MSEAKKASGCLFGLAIGDALGADTEFLSVAEIKRRFPPDGPQDLYGNPARVTDDTQMSLAVGEALAQAEKPLTPQTLEKPLRQAFVDWWESPENNRAPGRTCLTACSNLAQGLPWVKATVGSSKGCGANMRVAPVALLPESDVKDEQTRAAIAQFQAALTHGHPTGLAASDITTRAIVELMLGTQPEQLPATLREYAVSQKNIYHEDWLGELWQRPGITSPESFIEKGWIECLDVLYRLDKALAHPDYEADPCLATGEGWVAEEAFATGLLCFLLFPDDPVQVVRRAVVTSGDSDSIACLAGAFAGAYHGLDAWPSAWLEKIEYRDRLAALGNLWD